MYYVTIVDDDNGTVSENGGNGEKPKKLVYKCRKCDYEDDTDTNSGVFILNASSENTASSFVVNEFTKYDATLPRLYHLDCMNIECPARKKNEKPEIIYVRENQKKMIHVYLCTVCNHTWKQSM